MTAFLALLGAVIGGIIGAFVGFFAIIALGYATGPVTNDGGIAMGAAAVGLPAGLVIGVIAGFLLVLRWRKSRAPHENFGLQASVAIGLVAAVLGGLYLAFLYEPPATVLRSSGPGPILVSEVRVPLSESDLEWYKNFRPNLWTYNDLIFSPLKGPPPELDGDEIVWRSRHDLDYDYPERTIRLWTRPKLVFVFDLNVPGNPPHQDEFSDWQGPSHVREDTYGDDLPGPFGARIRYRIDRSGT